MREGSLPGGHLRRLTFPSIIIAPYSVLGSPTRRFGFGQSSVGARPGVRIGKVPSGDDLQHGCAIDSAHLSRSADGSRINSESGQHHKRPVEPRRVRHPDEQQHQIVQPQKLFPNLTFQRVSTTGVIEAAA